jgi:hypothetical protein
VSQSTVIESADPYEGHEEHTVERQPYIRKWRHTVTESPTRN